MDSKDLIVVDSSKQKCWTGMLLKNEKLGIGNPCDYLLEDGWIWKGSDYRLRRTVVFPNKQCLVDFEKILPRLEKDHVPVIIFGEEKMSLDDVITKDRKYDRSKEDYDPLPMQLREDWCSDECGFEIGNSTHKHLQKISYLEATKIYELKLIEKVAETEKTVTVRVTNPFNVVLDCHADSEIEFLAHYESGPGKPHAEFKPLTLHLPPGESTEIEVDIKLPDKPERKYATEWEKLHSLRIKGILGDIEFDIDFNYDGEILA